MFCCINSLHRNLVSTFFPSYCYNTSRISIYYIILFLSLYSNSHNALLYFWFFTYWVMISDLCPLPICTVTNLRAGDSIRLNLKIISLIPFIFFSHTFNLCNFLANKFNDLITVHMKNISFKIRYLLTVYALFLA